ncbi:MAG: DUF4386 domain-containing protein [Bacteroidota bacterium]
MEAKQLTPPTYPGSPTLSPMPPTTRRLAMARWTGVGYLIIFLSGFYGNFYVLQSLVVAGDAPATLANLLQNPGTYRAGVAAFLIMVLADLVLAWPLFQLLQDAHPKMAFTSSLLRVLNAGFFFAALTYLFSISKALSTHSPEASHIMAALDQFNRVWTWGLLVFGVHLLLLGSLLYRSASFPRLLGILIGIAGLGYLVDCSAQLWMPQYAAYQSVFEIAVVIPGVIGEFSLTLWLLIKGISKD